MDSVYKYYNNYLTCIENFLKKRKVNVYNLIAIDIILWTSFFIFYIIHFILKHYIIKKTNDQNELDDIDDIDVILRKDYLVMLFLSIIIIINLMIIFYLIKFKK